MRKTTEGLQLHDGSQQLGLLDASVHDPRVSVPTGFVGLDSLLRRGGLVPGTLVLLGGRTGTRKSTVITNMMVSMAQANIPVGLVGLDEQPWQYTASILSVASGKSRDWVEQMWDEPQGRQLRKEYADLSRGRIHLLTGRKPTVDDIEAQVELAGVGGESPKVVFIDYLNKMTRNKEYGWDEVKRIPRLVEHLGEWSTATGVVVVALHQLSRNDEFGGTNARNAGHLPVTLAQLKYGGEEDADMVLGTYRPAMDPLGTMSKDMAELALGDRFDEEAYWEARSRVRKYEHSTFLQLLKNRPGVHREERGIELLSSGESLFMEEKEAIEYVAETEEEDEPSQGGTS